MSRKSTNPPSALRNEALGIALIPLTRNQFAIVDIADADWLEDWLWFAIWNPRTRSYYAKTNLVVDGIMRGKSMQTAIVQMDHPDAYCGDHKHHNTLDNRRCNLRPATREENARNCRINKRNTSGYKGVTWYEPTQKWVARIKVNGQRIHLGCFTTPEEAHQVYVAAAEKYHGAFAGPSKRPA